MYVDGHGQGGGRGSADILRVEDVRIAFALQGRSAAGHPNEVVRGVSFRVPAGKTVALVGESGSGKSVISQAIMGLLPKVGAVTGGRILFNDPAMQTNQPVDLTKLSRGGPEMRALRGGRIGMIFQEPMSSLSPVHTIGNQVQEALQLHRRVDRSKARAKTEDMLGRVGFRDPKAGYDRYPFELSGGMRQRAMLAMALICRPALLIADEPTTALDVTIQAQVLKLMRDLQRDFGMAILLITHDLGVVANMADEVVVVYHGAVMEAGPVEDIFRRPAHPYLKALLKAMPRFDMAEGERLKSIRDVAPVKIRYCGMPISRRSGTLLEIKHLCKAFKSRDAGWFGTHKATLFKAVDDVGFAIERGECLGLVGESGCGKTTLSKVVMRAINPDSGSVRFDDGTASVDVLALKGAALRAFRRRVQLIFQDPVGSLSPRMTVLNILREPLDIHGVPDAEARVRDLMRAVGLDERFLNRYPHSFSGGQRQRIGIARALALDPQLLVCDEPVSALDVSVQAQILNLLKDLQRDLGLTYLFISHNLAVVGYMADRIAVMAGGRIVEIAPRARIFRAPAHPYTRALLAAVPFADLDRRLDFEQTRATAASDATCWPAAFRGDTADTGLTAIDLGAGHLVLARPTVDASELRP